MSCGEITQWPQHIIDIINSSFIVIVSYFRLSLDAGHVAGFKQGSVLASKCSSSKIISAMQGQIFIMTLITAEDLNLFPTAKIRLDIPASV